MRLRFRDSIALILILIPFISIFLLGFGLISGSFIAPYLIFCATKASGAALAIGGVILLSFYRINSAGFMAVAFLVGCIFFYFLIGYAGGF